MIAVHKALDPVLISEYSDDFEIIVVECKLGGKETRIITGYGPQENLPEGDRFFFLHSFGRRDQQG